MTTINPDYSVNKKTGRFVKKGSRTHSKMLKMGEISDNLPEKVEEKVQKVEEKVQKVEEKEEIKYNDEKFKENLKNTMKKIIKENNKDFKGLSQKKSDELLKKMLYNKLCIDKPKPKQNNKSKLKFKVRSLDSSDESSSDSDDE